MKLFCIAFIRRRPITVPSEQSTTHSDEYVNETTSNTDNESCSCTCFLVQLTILQQFNIKTEACEKMRMH
jgi:hypothetical protein